MKKLTEKEGIELETVCECKEFPIVVLVSRLVVSWRCDEYAPAFQPISVDNWYTLFKY